MIVNEEGGKSEQSGQHTIGKYTPEPVQRRWLIRLKIQGFFVETIFGVFSCHVLHFFDGAKIIKALVRNKLK